MKPMPLCLEISQEYGDDDLAEIAKIENRNYRNIEDLRALVHRTSMRCLYARGILGNAWDDDVRPVQRAVGLLIGQLFRTQNVAPACRILDMAGHVDIPEPLLLARFLRMFRNVAQRRRWSYVEVDIDPAQMLYPIFRQEKFEPVYASPEQSFEKLVWPAAQWQQPPVAE